jgi:hypothetical protein
MRLGAGLHDSYRVRLRRSTFLDERSCGFTGATVAKIGFEHCRDWLDGYRWSENLRCCYMIGKTLYSEDVGCFSDVVLLSFCEW